MCPYAPGNFSAGKTEVEKVDRKKNEVILVHDKTNDKTRLIKPQNDAQSLSATCRTSVCEVLGWMGMNALSKDVHEPGEACDA